MYTKIVGTGSYLPKKVLTNDDIAQLVDTNDEWIRERTGIQSRHIVEDETTVTMASMAAKDALENANLQPEDIDLIIVATVSADNLLPSTACSVQKELGAVNATAFDINAACSGFLFALNTADAYIKTGMYKNALLIGVETLSKIVDWNDRGTCILFGDGAGAAVVAASETPGILAGIQGADGAGGDVRSQPRKGDSFSFRTLNSAPPRLRPRAQRGRGQTYAGQTGSDIIINRTGEKINEKNNIHGDNRQGKHR